MKKKFSVIFLTLAVLLLGLFLSSCVQSGLVEPEENAKPSEQTEQAEQSPDTTAPKPQSPIAERKVEEVAQEIVVALKNQDMLLLSEYVHPEKGVRFSPYGYVDTQNHLVFSASQVQGLFADSTIYHWGEFDGTGDSMDLTFPDYYARFIYDQDYATPEQMAVNQRLGQGNSLDNTLDVFPNGTVVEYHFSGFDPQYAGMDWRSLRLVLEQVDHQWYLVAIIHDEWTT